MPRPPRPRTFLCGGVASFICAAFVVGAALGGFGQAALLLWQRGGGGAVPTLAFGGGSGGDASPSSAGSLRDGAAASAHRGAAAAAEGATRAGASAASAAASDDESPPPDAEDASLWETSQLCHQLPDDSEFCVYTGPLCWAGGTQVVALRAAPGVARGMADTDGRGGSCIDGRDYEPRDNCAWSYLGEGRHADGEPWPPTAPAEAVSAAAAHGASLASLPTEGLGRAWGPQGRNVRMGHVPPSWVAARTSEAAAEAAGGAIFAAALDAARRAGEADLPPARRQAARETGTVMLRPPRRVTWLPADGGVPYIASLPPGAFSHPWHFAIATFGLWAARRMNASTREAAAGGGGHAYAPPPRGRGADGGGAPPFRYRVGGSAAGGALPPLAALIVATSELVSVSNYSYASLPAWPRETIGLMLPPGGTAMLPADAAAAGFDERGEHWLCAARGGVVLGEKSRLFTGAGDAHAWRRAAYAAAGLPAGLAWPAYPPRTITMIVRERYRAYTNNAAVLALVEATGLPVRSLVVTDRWTWRDQVTVFAHTGILIASHGAALTNVIYMPPHAAVIEVSAYLGAVPVFRRIAEAARVAYHPLHARMPSEAAQRSGYEGMEQYNTTAFHSDCPPAGLPSADAPLVLTCNLASKRSNIEMPLDELQRVLERALDDIGCRGGLCRNADGSNTDFRPAAEEAKRKHAAAAAAAAAKRR